MKQVVVHGPRKAEIVEVGVPSPRPDEVLIKTEVSSISIGTENKDLHWAACERMGLPGVSAL